MKFRLLFSLLLLALAGQAQSFQNFINYINSLPTPAQQQAAVDSFLTQLPVAPLLEHDTLAHFIYAGAASSVQVAGDFNGWSPTPDPMTKLASTTLWYRTKIFEPNARLDYKLVINGSNWILDPRNPNTVSGGFGPNSELAMPQYVQPWEIVNQTGIAKGNLQTFNFNSAQLGGSYQVQVYLPPSYTSHPDRTYPSIYVQDGQEYLTLGAAKNVLDNLIDAGLISEIVGVFIRPNNRNEEYAFSKRNQYRAFIVEEIIPHVKNQYRVQDTPESRAVLGTSFGANISAQIAFYHPDIVGKAGLHSPAFWPNDFETSGLLLQGGLKPIQWAAVWGTYEGSVFQNMQIVQPGMQAIGYDFYGNYYPEGHSWGLWRATLDEILIELFPPGLVSVGEAVIEKSATQKIWPNPARPGEEIRLENAGSLGVRLFSAHGRLIGEWRPGSRIVLPESLPPGAYLLSLSNGKAIKVQVAPR
jgi:enterochelin esterase-like enzyme